MVLRLPRAPWRISKGLLMTNCDLLYKTCMHFLRNKSGETRTLLLRNKNLQTYIPCILCPELGAGWELCNRRTASWGGKPYAINVKDLRVPPKKSLRCAFNFAMAHEGESGIKTEIIPDGGVEKWASWIQTLQSGRPRCWPKISLQWNKKVIN